MSKETKDVITISPMFLLFVVFMILRLTHTIDWSWWWITAPLWVPVAFIVALVGMWGIIALIICIIELIIDRS